EVGRRTSPVAGGQSLKPLTSEELEAARRGEADLVSLLIARGADVNVTSTEGSTALMAAAERGRADTVERLLRGGASVDTTDEGGETALMLAAREGHMPVVEKLRSAGADVSRASPSAFIPEMVSGTQLLTDAAHDGDHRLVGDLVAKGVDVNGVGRTG